MEKQIDLLLEQVLSEADELFQVHDTSEIVTHCITSRAEKKVPSFSLFLLHTHCANQTVQTDRPSELIQLARIANSVSAC